MKRYRRHFWILGAIFIYVLFSFITKQTPLAGDDWGYAINGTNNDAFKATYEFYMGWSGRILSELWGFIVAPRRFVWDFLNPLFFSSIFISIYYLVGDRKNYIVSVLSILALILSVDDNLRMETYSWLMGATIVIPLVLSLLYFCIINYFIFGTPSRRAFVMLGGVSNVLLMYIGLTYENIALAMIVAIMVLIIYNFYNKKITLSFLFINLLISITGFTIMRLSPGSSYRLLSEHGSWEALSVMDKITNGFPKFIEFSFINNNYLIATFSIVLSILIIQKFKSMEKRTLKAFALASVFVNAMAIFIVFSFVLSGFDWIRVTDSPLSVVFWIGYIVTAIVTLFICMNENKEKAIFFLVIGGICNASMIFSPAFGSRASIYTVFYVIVTIGLIIKELQLNTWLRVLFAATFCLIILNRTSEYIDKYTKVAEIDVERMGQIEYYKHNSHLKDGWITRMPPYTIHGADIEPDDEYHLNTFKEYYGINPEMNIIFGWKESYD